MSTLRTQMRYMNPYDLHKVLINEYVLKRPGDAKKLLQRDTSRDKTDQDVLRENHKFLWDDESGLPDTWEAQFAKKYYDKLFKEYCIGDLSLYKENKIALRWRTEQEVVVGKGQFICANKRCDIKKGLKTWEVNFAYHEQGEKKNALVKIRLCPECSLKLNYHSKKREVKRLVRKKSTQKHRHKEHSDKRDREGESSKDSREKEGNSSLGDSTVSATDAVQQTERCDKDVDESPWEQHKPVETKSRDEEMEEYLQDLLL